MSWIQGNRFTGGLVGALVLLGPGALAVGLLQAASFSIPSGTNTTAQILGTGAGQTGSVSSGATLSVSGSSVAVTISGNSATLTNLGTIDQTGSGRAVRDNTGVTGLVINNGSASNSTALMRTANADVVQMNVTGAAVTVNNYGTMNSLNSSAGGAQALDFNAIVSGLNAANVINNFGTGFLLAFEADVVRTGVNGVVVNNGTIKSTRATNSTTGTDGIDAQNNSGAQITNTVTSGSPALIEGARAGIVGGALNSSVTFTTSVTNNTGATITGKDGAGINLDGFNANQSATIVNAGTITGRGVTSDGDGIDVDGLVNLTNTGTIISYNAFSATNLPVALSEGVTVGGGTIINSGVIRGLVESGNTNAVGRGISFLGNDITSGPNAGQREGIYGNATVTNQNGGLIYGQSDAAIIADGLASGFVVTVNNEAGGTIQGGGAGHAAIHMGADNDVINNSGSIDGSANGMAIDGGAGNNTVSISGGSASVLGSINGGVGGTNTLSAAVGAGNTFSFSDSLLNFQTVEVLSGLMALSGQSTYTGTTQLTGGTLRLNGTNRLSTSSTLNLNGGTLETVATGTDAQTFTALVLGNSSLVNLNASSLTFNGLTSAAAGKTLTIQNYSAAASPDYAIRIAGDLSTSSTFLSLVSSTTINGVSATFRYDGSSFTNIMPTPEPSTFALAGAFLFLVPFLKRRFAGEKRS